MTQRVRYLRNSLTQYCIIMPQNKILRFNQRFPNYRKHNSYYHFHRESPGCTPRRAIISAMFSVDFSLFAFPTKLMKKSRIKSGMTMRGIRDFSLHAYLLKLWLFEPLYLPLLRGTFLSKKA